MSFNLKKRSINANKSIIVTPHLVDYIDRVAAFLSKTRSHRDEQQDKRDNIFQIAQTHYEAHEYKFALGALGEIPAQLMTRNCVQLRYSCETKLSELTQLLAEIHQRVNVDDFNGLLLLTERVLELQPHNPSVLPLHYRLEVREAELKQAHLLEEIRRRVDQNELLGLKQLTALFLERSPNHPQVLPIHNRLEERETASTIAKAEQAYRDYDDEEALLLLQSLPASISRDALLSAALKRIRHVENLKSLIEHPPPEIAIDQFLKEYLRHRPHDNNVHLILESLLVRRRMSQSQDTWTAFLIIVVVVVLVGGLLASFSKSDAPSRTKSDIDSIELRNGTSSGLRKSLNCKTSQTRGIAGNPPNRRHLTFRQPY